MKKYIFYSAGDSAALRIALNLLPRFGYSVIDHPAPEVTHLLLPVPSMNPDGTIKGGGCLEAELSTLPETVTVIGGNLPSLPGHPAIDLLRDPFYLAENAAITAHCAIKHAVNRLPVTLDGCPVLIIGWGRIGKCLARLLRCLGAEVTVAARKAVDRAMIQALGYGSDTPSLLHRALSRYRVIFNTVPAPVLSLDRAARCREDCLKIDLASVKGIEGEDVLWARGLPGIDAPESSGMLIAKSIHQILAEQEELL